MTLRCFLDLKQMTEFRFHFGDMGISQNQEVLYRTVFANESQI